MRRWHFYFPNITYLLLNNVKYYLTFRPHENKTYLAVGTMKTVMLNVSLFNAGDDAYETVLHVKLPSGLYFTKILDLVSIKNHSSMIPYFIFLM